MNNNTAWVRWNSFCPLFLPTVPGLIFVILLIPLHSPHGYVETGVSLSSCNPHVPWLAKVLHVSSLAAGQNCFRYMLYFHHCFIEVSRNAALLEYIKRKEVGCYFWYTLTGINAEAGKGPHMHFLSIWRRSMALGWNALGVMAWLQVGQGEDSEHGHFKLQISRQDCSCTNTYAHTSAPLPGGKHTEMTQHRIQRQQSNKSAVFAIVSTVASPSLH